MYVAFRLLPQQEEEEEEEKKFLDEPPLKGHGRAANENENERSQTACRSANRGLLLATPASQASQPQSLQPLLPWLPSLPWLPQPSL